MKESHQNFAKKYIFDKEINNLEIVRAKYFYEYSFAAT